MGKLKIIPLKMHQQVWTWVGVYPVDENSNKWKIFAIYLFTFAILMAHLSLIIASIVFIMQADYEGTLHAISLVTMIIATAYVLIIAFIKRHKVVVIFDMLPEIHLRCKQTSLKFQSTGIE